MIITKNQFSRCVAGLCVLLVVLEVQQPCDAKPAVARVRLPKTECSSCINSECMEKIVEQICSCMCHTSTTEQPTTTLAPVRRPRPTVAPTTTTTTAQPVVVESKQEKVYVAAGPTAQQSVQPPQTVSYTEVQVERKQEPCYYQLVPVESGAPGQPRPCPSLQPVSQVSVERPSSRQVQPVAVYAKEYRTSYEPQPKVEFVEVESPEPVYSNRGHYRTYVIEEPQPKPEPRLVYVNRPAEKYVQTNPEPVYSVIQQKSVPVQVPDKVIYVEEAPQKIPLTPQPVVEPVVESAPQPEAVEVVEKTETKIVHAGATDLQTPEVLPQTNAIVRTESVEVPAVEKKVEKKKVEKKVTIVEEVEEEPEVTVNEKVSSKCDQANCSCGRCPYHDCNCGHRCGCYCGCGCGGPRSMCRRSLDAAPQVATETQVDYNQDYADSLSPLEIGYGDPYVRQARSDLIASLASEPIQDPRMFLYLADNANDNQQSSAGSAVPMEIQYRPARDLTRSPRFFPFDPLYVYQIQPDFSYDEMSYPGTSQMMVVPVAVGQQPDSKAAPCSAAVLENKPETSTPDNDIKREEIVTNLAVPAEPAVETKEEPEKPVEAQTEKNVEEDIKIKPIEGMVTPATTVTEKTNFDEFLTVTTVEPTSESS